MGYETTFEGRFLLNKPLDKKHYDFLVKFSETRRMARDFSKVPKSFDLSKDYGIDGEFYVDGTGPAGQDKDESVFNFNRPPLHPA